MPGRLDIEFPVAGVVRRFGHAQTGQKGGFGTPYAYNCRLEDALTNRLRGGSFTGQAAATITADASTDTLTAVSHGYVDHQPLQLTTTDALPDPLETDTTYYVVNAASDTFQLAEVPGGTAIDLTDAGAGTNQATPILTKSSPVYRDRAITFSNNAILAARQGDSTDTELSADVSDVARPILFQLSEAGFVGGNMVAVAPHKDAFLVCFTATETWVLQGDPARGNLRRVSDRVGIIGASAWCIAHDTVYWMSEHGLYQMQADGSGLQAVSEDRVPEDLTGVDDSSCSLNYHHPDRGVYIHLASAPSWFYDTARQGFWPFDTSESDSHLLVGPIKLGDIDQQGQIQAMHGMTAAGSATVNWRIVPGTTAEEAAANGKAAIAADLALASYSSYIRESGSWTAGRSYTERPRTTAMWVCLWLSSSGTWAWERLTMSVIPAGAWRG
jgi:hypothetical protein